MELTVQNVYGLLIRSKLLSLDEARAMFARWQQEAKGAEQNVARFAGWMVQNRFVTEYQAALLARGHGEGFFLNEYKILDRLGKGRMAGVYKAQHRLGQVVAIKVLPPSKAREPNFLSRFQREARMAMRLKHPNIVRTFQLGQVGELHYIVMEYLEGETVDEYLARRKRLSPAEAAPILFQALLGLQHMHSLGLVHRDMKPANMMLVHPAGAAPENAIKSVVKILDIGLGRALTEDVTRDQQELDSSLTGEGVLLGTPDYMAPEQARDARGTDIRADIYSLGCVLYHLLAGHPPFPDTNIISQMIRHATETPRPLKEFNPQVPDGLQSVVNWMMAKDPNQRYPTPERAATALKPFMVSGADTVPLLDADPRMRTYLTWLESDNARQAKPPSGTVPMATPVKPPAASPAKGAQPRPEKKGATSGSQVKKHPHKKKKKGKRPTPLIPPVPGAAPPPGIDVELVPVSSAAAASAARPSPLRLTRRELILFGAGAGVGAVATFLGCYFAIRGRQSSGEGK